MFKKKTSVMGRAEKAQALVATIAAAVGSFSLMLSVSTLADETLVSTVMAIKV